MKVIGSSALVRYVAKEDRWRKVASDKKQAEALRKYDATLILI